MKKLVFGLIATVMFGFVSNAQSLEESTAIITNNRVENKECITNSSARSFILKNFDENYKPLNEYTIDGEGFTDDGKYNDVTAGDGVYTSVVLSPNIDKVVVKVFVNDLFKYEEQLNSSLNKSYIDIGCKTRVVHSGTSWFGNSCARGCIELYDCSFKLHLEF